MTKGGFASGGSLKSSPAQDERRACFILVLALTLIVGLICAGTFLHGTTISIGSSVERFDMFFAEPGKYDFKYEYDPSLFLNHLPFESFVRNNYLKGIIPLWSDRLGCGFSLVGDVQGRIFAPLTLLLPCKNQNLYNLRLILEFLVGAIGTAYLCRQQVTSNLLICLYSGVCFCLSPLMFSQHELPNHYWLYPWILLSLYAAVQKGGASRIYSCALLLTFSLASGHCECMFFAISFGSIYAILPASLSLAEMRSLLMLRFWRLTMLGTLTLALSAPIILPFLEFSSNCYVYKSDQPTSWNNNVLFFLGSLSRPLCGMKSPFLGPLLGALAAPMVLSMRSTSLLALLVLIFVTRLFPFGLLLERHPLCELLPLYAIPLFAFMVILLSAKTLSQINTDAALKRRTIISLALAALWLLLPYEMLKKAWIALCGSAAGLSADPPFYTLISLSSVALAIAVLLRRKRSDWIVILSIALINSAGLVLSGLSLIPEQKKLITPIDFAIQFLQTHDERALSVGPGFLEPNLLSGFAIRDFNLCEPQFPRRYLAYAEMAGAQRLFKLNWRYSPPLSDLLSIASVRYFLVSANESEVSHEPKDNVSLIMKTPRVKLFENKLSLPQAYLVRNTIFVSSLDDAKAALRTNSKRVLEGELAVIEKNPAMNKAQELERRAGEAKIAGTNAATLSSQQLKIYRRNCNKVEIATDLNEAGYLVFTDSYYPGWKAAVDGKETEIFPTNVLFRSIKLPAGKHSVLFEYRPQSFLLGTMLFALASLGMILHLLCRAYLKKRVRTSS